MSEIKRVRAGDREIEYFRPSEIQRKHPSGRPVRKEVRKPWPWVSAMVPRRKKQDVYFHG